MGFLHVFGAEAGRAAATADEAKQSEETIMERLTILAAKSEVGSFVFRID